MVIDEKMGPLRGHEWALTNSDGLGMDVDKNGRHNMNRDGY